MTNDNPALDALLPCPFCGGEPEIERMGTSRVSMIISCGMCGASVETGETWIDKNSRWNTRPQPCGDAVDGKDYKKLYWDLLESWSDLKIKHGVLQEKLEAALTQPKADVEGLKRDVWHELQKQAPNCNVAWAVNFIIDHLAAQGYISVPEGYALVPIEPTDKLLLDMAHRIVKPFVDGNNEPVSVIVKDIYKAMLETSPKKEG